MKPDVVDLQSFYASPLGHVAHHAIKRIVTQLWPNSLGLSVLGLGYAAPWLDDLARDAVRTIAFMPAEMGIAAWPAEGPSATALVDTLRLPLPDACIDRLLLVHALETSTDAERFLAEIWRVLAPAGRLIALVPNRRGLWARFDHTPFGNGRPFSRGQLREIMREALLSPLTIREALYMPPSDDRLFLQLAPALETVGRRLALPGAGVLAVEATKLLYRPVSLRVAQQRPARAMQPALASFRGRGQNP
ncbi:MAG: methyltransferase domain-containing protein [Hyphomicrobiales bacterium]|nr:methyltransferase domain-containing protein [Hyphomicrobiales bacterium]